MPFRSDVEWPETYAFSPFMFREPFLEREWFAFEETNLSEEMTDHGFSIFGDSILGSHWYSIAFPCSKSNPKLIEFLEPTAAEIVKLRDDYWVSQEIRWNSKGLIIFNYFSDFFMSNMIEPEASSIYGRSLKFIYLEAGELEPYIRVSQNISEANKRELDKLYNSVAKDIRSTWKK